MLKKYAEIERDICMLISVLRILQTFFRYEDLPKNSEQAFSYKIH